MNLTKLFVAGLCFTAMTASAAYVKTNAFETGEDQSGWWVGDSDTLTTRSVTNDSINGRSAYAGTTPLTGTANERVLKLDTEGAVWTNTVTGASFLSGDIYADMLVKFVPSEDLPTLAVGSGKLALAIKANAGGTNMLNVASNDGGTFPWVETAQEISTTEWYRVTVKLTTVAEVGTYAQVYINSAAVGSLLTLDGVSTDLEAIGFQGTGYIDEVVVRTDNPLGGAATLTLEFATGVGSVYVGETQKTTGQTVTSGDELIILAANFYEIASVTGVSTSWSVGGVGETGGVVTVTSATNATLTITAQSEQNSTPYAGSGSFTNYPASDVATWAIANGVNALTEGIYENYLLNIDDEATVPEMNITSVAVSGTTVTVTVTAGSVDLQQINGTLKIKTYDTLGGTETVTTATVTGWSPATISQDIGTAKFVKVMVE